MFECLGEILQYRGIFFQLSGGTPFWIDYWEDLKEIIGDIRDLVTLLFTKKESETATSSEIDQSTVLTDGVTTTVREM